MSGYDKKIRYLDYCEQGERQFGAGFVKLENRNAMCSISLQISGLKSRGHFSAPLLLMTPEDERELVQLQFADGCARTCLVRLAAHDLDGRGLEYDDLLGVRVPLSGGSEVRCVWGRKPEQVPVPASTANVIAVGDALEAAKLSLPEEEIAEEQTQEPEKPAVHSDKWQQIFSIYPQIHPFEDDRVYLSIGPGDFVLLSAKSYSLVNNSFLLHGFYSYGHLILTRIQNRSGVRYYIGVPGSYYERERRIAVMFGFESFECRREPAREGDFGYYMIPVDL